MLRSGRKNVFKHNTRVEALLRRLAHCGHCGSLIQPSFTRKDGREYRYYACSRKIKLGYGRCPLPMISAGELEKMVVDQLRALFRHPDVIARTYREVRRSAAGPDAETVARLKQLQGQREQTQKSIRALLQVGETDEGYLTEQIKRLNKELKSLEVEIRKVAAQPGDAGPMELHRVTAALRAVDPVWDALFPAEQRRILQLLVENIILTTSSVDIRFRANGIEQIVEELQPVKERQHA